MDSDGMGIAAIILAFLLGIAACIWAGTHGQAPRGATC